MKFIHMLNRLTGAAWLINDDALVRITDLLEARMGSGIPSAPMGDDDDEDDGDDLPAQTPGVGVVVVNGTLGNHLSMLEQSCGGVDYGALLEEVREAAYDPFNLSVVLHFQICPGGMANGCPETFAALREIRAETGKPMVAVVTGMACSGGYYLASACDSIMVTESSMVGSIGVMRMVEDRSEANAKAGNKRFAITSAKMKDIGNPDRPMTDEELGVMKDYCQQLAAMFLRDVKSGRPGIAPEVFETGLPYYGAKAVSLGLADAVVPSVETVIASMAPVAPMPMPMR